MGCVNSKKVIAGAHSSSSPPPLPAPYVHSSSRHWGNASGRHSTIAEPPAATTDVAVSSSRSRGHSEVPVLECQEGDMKSEERRSRELKDCRKGSLRAKGSLNMRLGGSYRFVEAEQNAAGWPPWLTSVAGEAIQGWVPLKTDSFEKLDKVGERRQNFSIVFFYCCHYKNVICTSGFSDFDIFRQVVNEVQNRN